MSSKSFLIADSIHGSVQLSQMEKLLISTQAFNRLHFILQNSTAYLTYPSNRTSRFTHSIGAMHMCGQIFQNSISNAAVEDRDAFFTEAKDRLEKHLRDRGFMSNLRTRAGDSNMEGLLDNKNDLVFCDRFYEVGQPPVRDEHKWVYCVLLQAIRCAALLHDIGHPPFSHVTEAAMKELHRKKDEAPRNSRWMRMLKCLDYSGDSALHESLGNKIAARLLDHVARVKPHGSSVDMEDARCQFLYLLVMDTSLFILEEEDEFFQDLHRIVAGSMDGDRLDYVTRDLENSGFMRNRLDYSRLLASMRLMQKEGRFWFCPDIRSLSVIEDFFRLRWSLYKYVVFHHRVRKTDALLRRAVHDLSLEYLNQSGDARTGATNMNPGKSYSLPVDISGLWEAVGEAHADKTYFDALIQWDDAWLLAVLRKHYYDKHRDGKSELSYQLEELLSNKKRYISVVKRMTDFREIDRACANHVQITPELANDLDLEMAKSGKNGFFLAALAPLYDQIFQTGDFESMVLQVIRDLESKHEIGEILVLFNPNKATISEEPYVNCHGVATLLSEVSSIGGELDQNARTFPVFFVYVPDGSRNMADLRIEIGTKIAERVSSALA